MFLFFFNPNSYAIDLTFHFIRVISPLFNNLAHIIRQIAIKRHLLFCNRMNKTNGFSMKRLSLASGETVFSELFIFVEDCSI